MRFGALCEPQIDVPVWHTPSAGVGDTRPFALSVVSARGRRRKHGAAASAMLGHMWAAGCGGGGSVASASRSSRLSNSSAGAPACVARACNSAGPPAAQARTCSAALRQGEGCVTGGAMRWCGRPKNKMIPAASVPKATPRPKHPHDKHQGPQPAG